MPSALRTLLVIATTAFLAAGGGVAQAADTPFTVRHAQTMRGDVLSVGNTSMSCPTAAANCTAARDRVSPFSNNDFRMANVDIDADATTFNSSSATVAVPAGGTITWAGLYWAADTSRGSNGVVAPSAASRDRVRVSVGASGYQTVTASQLLTSSPQPTRFRGFADVTGLLASSGTQTVTVANVQAGTGTDRFGGWALLVAYADPSLPIRRVSVYDGLGTVDATHTFSTTIAPFQTPANGTVTSRLGLVAFEGDDGYATETGTFNGVALTDGLNPANNFMNSTIEADGSHLTAKTPDYRNQLGVDIDTGGGPGVLANSQSSATLAFTSTQDYFMPSAFVLVSDEGPALNTGGPTVSGIARDGETLTATSGTWSGTPSITYGYQWQRCDAAGLECVDIPGATGSSYTLTPADVGSTIRVLVIATNDAGASPPAASTPSGSVSQEPPANTAAPIVTGSAQDEGTLTSTLGAWDGTGPLDYAYQWQRCDADGLNCADIAGATGSSYTLTDDDVDSTIRSTVTASNDEGSEVEVSAVSGSVQAAAPGAQTPPVVSGTTRDGETLSATTGTFDGTGPFTYEYRWRRCEEDGFGCVTIPGATSSTYELMDADVGHTIRAAVTATNGLGSDTERSVPSDIVVADPPANDAPPTASGTARDGETLTADPGSWDGTGPIDYTYTWERCDEPGVGCAAIPGATGPSYMLTGDDAGMVVQVVVTATNSAGTTPVTSVPTAVVAEQAPDNLTPPAVTGGAEDGATLTSTLGDWDGTGPLDYDYQWERCDTDGLNCVAIAGATGPTYTLTDADIGSTVRSTVQASNDEGHDVGISAVSAVVTAAAPDAQAPPAVSGTTRDGETLSATTGTFDGTGPFTYEYRWRRCDEDGVSCVTIPGETSSTYELTDADVGHTIRVAVTATNGAGSDTTRSAASDVVLADPPANALLPSVSGSARDGETLTVDPGSWGGTGPIDYTYTWERCDAPGVGCETIPGATGASYTLTGDDAGTVVRVVVTATNPAGVTSVTTVPTAIVAEDPPSNLTPPAVSGGAADGATLSSTPGAWDGTDPLEYEYQWERCDERRPRLRRHPRRHRLDLHAHRRGRGLDRRAAP